MIVVTLKAADASVLVTACVLENSRGEGRKGRRREKWEGEWVDR